MRKSIIYGIIILYCCSCSSTVEKGVSGWWTIDEIYYEGENILFDILSNSIYFEDDQTCKLPVSLNNEAKYQGTWEVLESDTVPYLLKIESENKFFDGVHTIYFENNQEERMLMMVINSKSLYVKCRKGMLHYASNESLIRELVVMTHP